MKKLYSLPGSLTATLKSERENYPVIDDVDFGRAKTFAGRAKKARAAGYTPVVVSIDMGEEFIQTTVFCKPESKG